MELQVETMRARGCGRAGSVSAACTTTRAVDGQSITLNGDISAEGQSKKGLALGLGIGLGLTVLPFVRLAFLAIKGEAAKIGAGSLINHTYVAGNYLIR